MAGLLADVNIEGHVGALLRILQSNDWRELWLAVEMPLRNFSEFGLTADVPDALLWHVCQRHELVLITSNRNNAGADSLEATIRAHNAPGSLPVFTLASAEAVLNSRAYADRAAIRLLEYLFDLDNLRGTGRLYLP
jgi:hypothetical protein